MNLQLVEKLRGLIANSSILTPNEKQEWEALLELMNDMQMRELEKILAPKVAQVSSSSSYKVIKPETPLISSIAEKSQSSSVLPLKIEVVKPKEEEKPKNNFVKPPLGHIINLPKAGASQILATKQPNLAVSAVQASTGKATFLQKLKAILREPELPEGQKEALLPVGKPENKVSIDLSNLKVPAKPVERTGLFVLKTDSTKQSTPLAVPLPPKKQVVQVALEKPIVAEKPKVQEPILIKKSDVEELSKLLSQKENLKPQIPQQKNQKTQTVEEVLQKQAPKIVDPKGLEKWPDQYNIKQDPHKVDASQYIQKAQNSALTKASAGAAKTVNLDVHEPKDLEKLETSWLDETSVKKFKDLVKHFGNYEVMQYLEKSPLYKAYMLTGSQILQDTSTFEAESKKNPQLLDKESFEKTADLLRVIQAE